jgi:hypothetical protein
MTQNSKATPKKRRGVGKPFTKGDTRINAGGRPKNEMSLTAIARRYLAMSPAAIGNEIKALSARYKALGVGDGATMAEYIMGSFLYAVANDPQPGNMRELWRRVDGEVAALNIDVATLTDDQLERLANGEDVYSVLAHRGDSGVREAQEDGGKD